MEDSFMPAWFLLSLITFFFIGVQRFLYKTIANRGMDPDITTFYFMSGVFVMSFLWYTFKPEPINDLFVLILLSFGNSLSFLIATTSHIRALKYIKASIAYPLIRLNIVLVVLFSVLVLNEDLKPSQMGGIVLALISMFVLAQEQKNIKGNRQGSNHYRGAVFILIAMICGATSSITSKLAAIKVTLIPYITISYFIASGSLFVTNHKKILKNTRKDVLFIGLLMSVLNFAGFYSYLLSLKIGPLAVISSINGLHFVVAVILSVIVYKEKLSKTNTVSVLLAIVSIILLRGF